jgi:fatty acid desaturase
MQAYQYLAMVSVFGIYYSNFEDLPHTVSFAASISMLAFLAVFLLFGVYKWIEFIRSKNFSKSKFNEFFNGLRRSKFASTYNLILILRRLLIICWLICFQWIPKMVLIPIVALYQFFHNTIVIIIRPFDHPKENLVEIANEIILTVVV